MSTANGVAIIPPFPADILPDEVKPIGNLNIFNTSIPAAWVPKAQPAFDAAGAHKHEVSLKKLAFSCNYRDRTLAQMGFAGTQTKEAAGKLLFVFIGSDFVAEVLEVGQGVEGLQPGDRVIPLCHYGVMPEGVKKGIPSNTASAPFDILPANKLIKVPKDMPISLAASFSVGAITAGSMLRKLDLQKGQRLLVTAGTSSTSKYIICGAKQQGIEVHAVTSSEAKKQELLKMGCDQVFIVSHEEAGTMEALKIIGGLQSYHGVADPMSDVWLPIATYLLDYKGGYTTCGVLQQGVDPKRGENKDMRLNTDHLGKIISLELRILGNCLGDIVDIEEAVANWQDFIPAGKEMATMPLQSQDVFEKVVPYKD